MPALAVSQLDYSHKQSTDCKAHLQALKFGYRHLRQPWRGGGITGESNAQLANVLSASRRCCPPADSCRNIVDLHPEELFEVLPPLLLTLSLAKSLRLHILMTFSITNALFGLLT